MVILLIGILSAVAAPRLFQSTDKAHKAAGQAAVANLKSSIKVLRADWLLAGQPNPYEIDGYKIVMSKNGVPVTFDGNNEDGHANARYRFCYWLTTSMAGIPAQKTIFAPDVRENVLPPTNPTWIVYTEQSDPAPSNPAGSESKCDFWYINGNYLQHVHYDSFGEITYKNEDTWLAEVGGNEVLAKQFIDKKRSEVPGINSVNSQ